MLFVIHATDKKDGMTTRAKFYRAHRIHLDQAEDHDVNVVTSMDVSRPARVDARDDSVRAAPARA